MTMTALLWLSTFVPLAQPAPPEAQDPGSVPPPPPAQAEGEAVTEDERGRIEAMFTRFAGMKLKGQKIDQKFRVKLIKNEDPNAPDEQPNTGPHEFGFEAQLPDNDKVFATKLISAETLGPKRYRLTVSQTVPFESLGGYYRFDGGGILGQPIGWVISNITAQVEVIATIDLGWKSLENGNIGIYPGGFLDPSLTAEQQKESPFIEDLQVEVSELDMSHMNLDGINGRRSFVRNGVGVGRGGLFRRLLGPGQREQVEQMIEGGVNGAIRNNQPKLLEGINSSIQSTLPETQLQITNFIEKLAVQANLAGSKKKPTPAPAQKSSDDLKPVPVESGDNK